MDKIAIVAGAGELPLIIINKIKQRREDFIVLAFQEIAKKEIEKLAGRVYWLHFGELNKLMTTLKKEQVRKLLFSGRIDKKLILQQTHFDKEAKDLLGKMKDKGDFSLLKTLADMFEKGSIELLSPYLYLNSFLTKKGTLGSKEPSEKEKKDIELGYKIAKNIAELDIGHTVVIKDGVIFAIETVEGTDAAILRGGNLAQKNAVVVKVARPEQDSRFDHPPVIGLNTIKTAVEANISVIAFEAGKTIVLEKEALIETCDANNIALVGI